jgi:SMI1-KNR4 cell-wall
MISIRVHGAKPAPVAASVEKVERAVGYNLPPMFLASFARVHGGVPESNMFAVGSDGQDAGVDEFLAFDSIPDEFELGGFRELGGYVPIAVASGGNYVCAKVTEPNLGGIYFWDHEIASPSECLWLIAESLDMFLDVLRPFDPKSVVLRPDQVIKAWIDPELLKTTKR